MRFSIKKARCEGVWGVCRQTSGRAAAEIPRNPVNLQDEVNGKFAENTVRKYFTPSEAVTIKRANEPEAKAAAKEFGACASATANWRSSSPPRWSRRASKDSSSTYADISMSSRPSPSVSPA